MNFSCAMLSFSLVYKRFGDFRVVCVCNIIPFFVFLHTHTPECLCGVARCTRQQALRSFDAFLSGPARFALFVFNDASREADSRRVERTAFDVSDYDITDVQLRRAEEWGSMLRVFSFLFLLPSGILFREKEGRKEQRHMEGEIKYLAKARMRFYVPKDCTLPIYYFARV